MSELEREIKIEQAVWARFLSRSNELAIAMKISKKNSRLNLVKALSRRIRDFGHLCESYEIVCKELARSQSAEMIVTPSEHDFKRKFAYTWRLILQEQVWIGNLCVDFFTDGLGQKKNEGRGFITKGIVFEIDGGAHLRPAKARKDIHKEGYLESLGISVWRLKDSQVYEYDWVFPTRSRVIKEFKPLCSRDRDRLRDRFQLVTLLCHGSDHQLARIFALSPTLFCSQGLKV
ncbi:MAG: hypothetical protein KF799_10015 [Bdellovibrionales bacterium]|nr:hypothetical protein [Bdellovibrionales bacterium]